MNVVVCIKQVPDTNLTVKVADDGQAIREDGIEYVTSPYDEHAIEAALQLKEKHGGEVTVLTLGPERATKALRDALAMGCDKAAHLNDAAFLGSDALATARAIAGWLKAHPADVVLCGKQAVDDDSAAVGQAIAQYLGVAHVAEIEKLETSADGATITVHRAVDGGVEVIECPKPAVLTAHKGLNAPRHASLKGIMRAKKVAIDAVNLAGAAVEASRVGREGSPTRTVSLKAAPEKSVTPTILTGDVTTSATELVRLLHTEQKIV